MKKVFPKFPPGGKALPHRHLHQAEDGQVHHGGEREDVRGAGRKELQQGRKVCQMFFQKVLKVCYLPATSAGLARVSFSFFLLLWPLTVLMKQTKQVVHSVKQSLYS
jgi:hypothetical protein